MDLEADIALSVVGGSRRALEHFAPGPVHALAAIQRAEINKWWPIIDAAGIKPQ